MNLISTAGTWSSAECLFYGALPSLPLTVPLNVFSVQLKHQFTHHPFWDIELHIYKY